MGINMVTVAQKVGIGWSMEANPAMAPIRLGDRVFPLGGEEIIV